MTEGLEDPCKHEWHFIETVGDYFSDAGESYKFICVKCEEIKFISKST